MFFTDFTFTHTLPHDLNSKLYNASGQFTKLRQCILCEFEELATFLPHQEGLNFAVYIIMAKLFLLIILNTYISEACTFCRSSTPPPATPKTTVPLNSRTPAKQTSNNLSADFFNSSPSKKIQKPRGLRIINSGIYE